MMNIGYKLVLADLGRPVTEKTSSTITTVADQQFYTLPIDCLFVKSIILTIGTVKYTLTEEESQEGWDYLNQYQLKSSIPEKYFLRLNHGVGKSEFGGYPIPSTAGYTFTIVYEVIDKDMTIDVFNTGNVTLTNGDETMTHSATGFTAAMVGRYVKGSDGFFYRIASFTSTSSVELDQKYEGSTVTTGALIYEIFNLPEEIQILPVYFALAHYFGQKKDTTQENKYWTLYTASLASAKIRHGTKSRSALTRGSTFRSRWAAWGPRFFPESAS